MKVIYVGAGRRRKGELLTEMQGITGMERKYLNKLMTGNRRHRARAARGPTYGEQEKRLLRRAWEKSGCPCAAALHAGLARTLGDLGELENVDADVARKLLGYSASTLGRMLRGTPRPSGPGRRRNRRSGRNLVAASVPVESGEDEIACAVAPGDVQVDSVWLCGGDASGTFAQLATATDRRTQWFEARPAMPASGEPYRRALDAALSAMPMGLRRIHSDNGSEFINALIQGHVRRKWPQARFSRSYPGRKNDNAHIEQKNGSVVRAWLGEIRVDRPEAIPLLWRLAENISLHTNLFRPVQMLTGRTKRENGKGYAKTYDAFRTPAQRVLDSPEVPETAKARIRRLLERTNSVRLYELILKQIARLRRMLEAPASTPEPPTCVVAALPAASPLRGAPSGTASSRAATTPPPPHAKPPLRCPSSDPCALPLPPNFSSL